MSSWRIGVIGTQWGRMHVGAFRAAGAELAVLCGRDGERTRRVAREEGIPEATTSVAELCRRVDVVVVAGPDALHLEHARTALQAGCAVLCEKPLARTEAEAEEMVALARASQRPAAVAFASRFLPAMSAVKRWLAGRRVEQLVATVRSSFAAAAGGTGEGPLLGASGDFGGMSHLVDAALWFLDAAPAWVQASLLGRPVHSASLHLGVEGGGVATLQHVACHEPGIHGAWSLGGHGWEVTFSAGYRPERGGWCLSPVRAFDGDAVELAPALEPRPGAVEPWAQAHVEAARDLLRALAGEPVHALASFEEGLRVQRVFGAAMRSELAGRRAAIA